MGLLIYLWSSIFIGKSTKLKLQYKIYAKQGQTFWKGKLNKTVTVAMKNHNESLNRGQLLNHKK